MTTSYGLGRFGDRRLEKSGAALHQALVKQPGPCVRRLARGSRACQMQFFRFLHNDSVTVREMAECAAAGVAARVAGREVLAIQDTSELVFGGKKARARGFGPIGRGGALGGLCLHPVLVVEAGTGSVLGLAHIQVWNRDGGKVTARRQRPTADKESQCWLEGMAKAAEVLSQARQVTVVGDGESDIYEEFARRPAHVHLITRVAQDRRVVTGRARRRCCLPLRTRCRSRVALSSTFRGRRAASRARRNWRCALLRSICASRSTARRATCPKRCG